MFLQKKNSFSLIGVNVSFGIQSLFVNTFLVAQIFILSGESLIAVALFAIIEIVVRYFTNLLTSILCKKINPIMITRLSAALSCFFILSIIWFSDSLDNYYYLWGVLWGVVNGLYWAPNGILVVKLFKKDEVKSYVVSLFVVNTAMKVIFPITFGALIDYQSFLVVSIAVGVVGLVQFLLSCVLKNKKETSSRLNFKGYFTAMKKAGFFRPTLLHLFNVLLFGVFNGIGLAITIMTLIVYGTNFSLGVFGSIFAICTVATLLLYKKFKIKHFWIAGIFPLLAALPMLAQVNTITIIIFQAFFTIFSVIIQTEEETLRINAVKFWGGHEFIIESGLLFAIPLNLGRIFSFSLILIAGALNGSVIVFATMICLMLICFSVHSVLSFFWKKKYATRAQSNMEAL